MSRPRSRSRVLAPAVAAAVLLLAGCATSAAPASSSPSSSTESSASASDVLDGEVTVYAAASLSKAFDAVADAFVAEHPDVRISPVYDGSSTLVTQLVEGAPADVFASADQANMDKASALTTDPALFASNTLVIAVPAGNPAEVRTLADLAGVTTVLCAPEVPCGAASTKLLSAAGVSVDPASLEQNVTAVMTKVAAGEADAGLVYATDVVGRSDVESIVPDGAGDVVNRYPIAALRASRNPDAAAAFVDFVLSDAGRRILTEYGFGAP